MKLYPVANCYSTHLEWLISIKFPRVTRENVVELRTKLLEVRVRARKLQYRSTCASHWGSHKASFFIKVNAYLIDANLPRSCDELQESDKH